MEKQTHLKIDNFNFHIESVSKSTEAEFIAQYKDQRQYGLSDADWMQWMKGAYKAIMAAGGVEKKVKPKG